MTTPPTPAAPTTPAPPHAPAHDIAVLIVTHHSAETIEDCLTRVCAADGVAAIRVVDNGSEDGTLEIIQRVAARDARLRFIANPDNPGFAVACNQGAADLPTDGPAAHATPWLAFVNPDCLIEPDTLARLRNHALRTGGDALVGADLVGEDGQRDAAARRRDPDFGAMLHGLLRARPAATRLGLPVDDHRALQPVEAISGALMLLPRALFQTLDGFDPGYRLHAEDLDLCRRARATGATVAVANDVRVLHVRGVSSRVRPVFVEWHKHRGLWRYFRKFEAARRGVLTRLGVWALVWGRFPVAVVRAWGRG
ncbi:glycosyltransferase family 2 protein [Agrilutibacter solisilvae]|uniref:Glycosyltransferase family 2 protein n=1 Tax=Agrilutibacter solisilvae TaxID=2763317 RepID=A0A975ATE2_9GAMM|nr:glycosyltransferase family 2 protein [Lysobacter solisilvae]QSX79732.1 glycosyltransferase family 2 protein [Lysobacter solisilvae]